MSKSAQCSNRIVYSFHHPTVPWVLWNLNRESLSIPKGFTLKNIFGTSLPSYYITFSCQIAILLGSYYMNWSYYMYCSDFLWMVLFIFITALLFLLYVLFEKKVDRTVNFYYCTVLPIIHSVQKNRPVIFISIGLIIGT